MTPLSKPLSRKIPKNTKKKFRKIIIQRNLQQTCHSFVTNVKISREVLLVGHIYFKIALNRHYIFSNVFNIITDQNTAYIPALFSEFTAFHTKQCMSIKMYLDYPQLLNVNYEYQFKYKINIKHQDEM